MKGLLIFIVSFSTTLYSVFAGPMITGSPSKCDGSGDAIVQCMKFLFDANADGNITFAEISNKLGNLTDLPTITIDEMTFMHCDVNDDGVLNMDDWNHPNQTCLNTTTSKTIACQVCIRNGFVMVPPDIQMKRTVVKYARAPNGLMGASLTYDRGQYHIHEKAYRDKAKAVLAELAKQTRDINNQFNSLKTQKRDRLQSSVLKTRLDQDAQYIKRVRDRFLGSRI